jgi:predicted nucleic acid-binding protein
MVIVDSGGLLALYDADDVHHADIVQCVNALKKPLVLPVAILAEADYIIRHFLGFEAELEFLRTLDAGMYALEPLAPQDLTRCHSLVDQYRDLDIGFADAAVIATAERLGVREILTVDQRDFRGVQSTLGPFKLLPFDS